MDELERVTRIVNDVCGGLTPGEKLWTLELAWMIVAHTARAEALSFPGEFVAELTRQLEQLRFVAFVASDVPDLEMARLSADGDLEGVLRYVQQLRAARGGDVQ